MKIIIRYSRYYFYYWLICWLFSAFIFLDNRVESWMFVCAPLTSVVLKAAVSRNWNLNVDVVMFRIQMCIVKLEQRETWEAPVKFLVYGEKTSETCFYWFTVNGETQVKWNLGEDSQSSRWVYLEVESWPLDFFLLRSNCFTTDRVASSVQLLWLNFQISRSETDSFPRLSS